MPTDKDDKNKDAQNAPEATEQSAEETAPADGQNGSSDGAEQSESALPKSQDELNKLIERRLKKERRAWEKAAAEQKPDTEPAEDNSKAEIAALRAELLEARAQSAAAKLGFKADAAEDAVYLAMRIANKDSGGEPDDDDIRAALSEVLKKHPEWKADSEKKNAGFRVGAPPPRQSENKNKVPAQKRWNRFNFN